LPPILWTLGCDRLPCLVYLLFICVRLILFSAVIFITVWLVFYNSVVNGLYVTIFKGVFIM